MRYLIAGGAGFLGSHLCQRLLGEGNEVVCVDNLLTGRFKNVSQFQGNKNFTFIECDIVKPLLSDEHINKKKIDIIYHLASPASPNPKSPKSYMQFPVETLLVNSAGTFNLLTLAQKHAAKFLYASSSEIYGEPKVHPQSEVYFGNVNPNGPRSCYDEGKRFGEAICFAFLRRYKLDIRVVRIFNTYGPRMDPEDGRVVSNFVVAAIKNKPLEIFGKGEQTRSFCYVDDLIDGLIRAMEYAKSRGEVYNLGNDREYSIKELVEILEKVWGGKLGVKYDVLPPDDPTRRRPDLTKARSDLGYNPKTDLEKGLIKTIEYFREELQ